MISIGGAGERGTNGTLRPATALTRSGASTDRFHITIAPQSCPTKIGLLLAERVEQAGHVGAQRHDVVGLDLRGNRAAPVAAHVRHDHAVAGVREHRQLVTPGEAELGKAVAENDERAVALLHDRQLDAVGSHPTLSHVRPR